MSGSLLDTLLEFREFSAGDKNFGSHDIKSRTWMRPAKEGKAQTKKNGPGLALVKQRRTQQN